MSITNTISQKIRQLDAGAFQKLCDAILKKEYSGQFVSYGSHADSNKTTKGTPDSYIALPSEEYIFIEYTTQSNNLVDKIKADIQKCLDTETTNVPVEKIVEIIYCHTSTNVSPGHDLKLKKMCEDHGITLTIFGIDQIAEKLYRSHREIAQDHLGIPFGTNQIMEYQQFIQRYDANALAAPLCTDFQFRKKEIESIDSAYTSGNVVILTGAAGVGKSRLALQYAKNHSVTHQETLLCIHDNALPIYEDLPQFISLPGDYFIFVDDANELSGLKYVIQYATGTFAGIRVKLLLTVRDYAIKKVTDDISKIVSFQNIHIPAFSDEEIKGIVKKHYGIHDAEYLSRIARIAEGNARIAMLAGKIALDNESIESLRDLTHLFDLYYGEALKNQDALDKETLQCAAIAVLLSPFRLQQETVLSSLLTTVGIEYTTFVEKLYTLHEKEIVQIHYDTVVRFSEQCLGNYLLKHVFIDKHYIQISDLIMCCFDTHYQQKMISALNAISHVFKSTAVLDCVRKEVCLCWEKIKIANPSIFRNYVKAFHRLNPTESLIYLQTLIDEVEINTDLPTIDQLKSEKNNRYINDDVLEVLCSLAYTDQVDTAFDLLFDYFLKQQNKLMRFFSAIDQYFGINRDSYPWRFSLQIKLFEKLQEHSNNWKNEAICLLFFAVAPEFLKLIYSPHEVNRKNGITIYTIQLIMNPDLMKLRHMIWDALMQVKHPHKTALVCDVLQHYGNGYSDDQKEIIYAEAIKVVELINGNLLPVQIDHCLLVKHVNQVITDCGYAECDSLSAFLDSTVLQHYQLLAGKKNHQYVLDDSEKKAEITSFVQNKGAAGLRSLIDFCADFAKTSENSWFVCEGLKMAFDALVSKHNDFIRAVQYYQEKDTPLNLNPSLLIEPLLYFESVERVFDIINQNSYSQKNNWLYAFFSEIPNEKITTKVHEQMLSYLETDDPKNTMGVSYRDAWFLTKYHSIDPKAFIRGCEILFSKFKDSPCLAQIYFMLLFHANKHAPEEVLKEFGCHYQLIEQLYFSTLRSDTLADIDAEFFSALLAKHPAIIAPLAEYICGTHINADITRITNLIKCIYSSPNYIEHLELIVLKVEDTPTALHYELSEFLQLTIAKHQGSDDCDEKKDLWIKHLIQKFNCDEHIMFYLFSVIAHMEDDSRIKYIQEFLQHNHDFACFKHLPLEPLIYSWSDSAVPMYSRQKAFLEKLSPLLTGSKYLKHRQHVQDLISKFSKIIDEEQIRDMLEN